MGVREVHTHGEGVDKPNRERDPGGMAPPDGSWCGDHGRRIEPENKGGEEEPYGVPLVFTQLTESAGLRFSPVGFFDESGESRKSKVKPCNETDGGGRRPEAQEDSSDEKVHADGIKRRRMQRDSAVVAQGTDSGGRVGVAESQVRMCRGDRASVATSLHDAAEAADRLYPRGSGGHCPQKHPGASFCQEVEALPQSDEEDARDTAQDGSVVAKGAQEPGRTFYTLRPETGSGETAEHDDEGGQEVLLSGEGEDEVVASGGGKEGIKGVIDDAEGAYTPGCP